MLLPVSPAWLHYNDKIISIIKDTTPRSPFWFDKPGSLNAPASSIDHVPCTHWTILPSMPRPLLSVMVLAPTRLYCTYTCVTTLYLSKVTMLR